MAKFQQSQIYNLSLLLTLPLTPSLSFNLRTVQTSAPLD